MHKGLLNGVIFLDLKKAIDIIYRRILLEKLKLYGVCVASLNWSCFIPYKKKTKKLVLMVCCTIKAEYHRVLFYNGGQKCWDLSSDITKTSDPSPPTPNKVEFGAKWVKLSAFLATTLLGEVGGTMG